MTTLNGVCTASVSGCYVARNGSASTTRTQRSAQNDDGDIDKTVIIRQASSDRHKMKLMILIKRPPKIALIKQRTNALSFSMKINYISLRLISIRWEITIIGSNQRTHIFRPLVLLTSSYFTPTLFRIKYMHRFFSKRNWTDGLSTIHSTSRIPHCVRGLYHSLLLWSALSQNVGRCRMGFEDSYERGTFGTNWTQSMRWAHKDVTEMWRTHWTYGWP